MTETIEAAAQDGAIPSFSEQRDRIHKKPPSLDDLAPGETRIVQLQRNQMGPDFPPRPCVYLYRRAGNRLFATLLEEVTK